MALRFTVMTPKTSDCPRFVADTAATSVIVTQPGPALFTFCNAAGNPIIQKGDSFTLLSYGVVLPENFSFDMSTHPPSNNAISFYLAPNTGTGYFRELGDSDGYMFLPMENFEMASNTFVDTVYNGVSNTTFTLIGDIGCLNGQSPYVSMLGVPAACDGVTYLIRPFIKIAHTLPILPLP